MTIGTFGMLQQRSTILDFYFILVRMHASKQMVLVAAYIIFPFTLHSLSANRRNIIGCV